MIKLKMYSWDYSEGFIKGLVVAENAAKARYQVYKGAIEAGYPCSFADVCVRRKSEYDQFATVVGIVDVIAEENIKQGVKT